MKKLFLFVNDNCFLDWVLEVYFTFLIGIPTATNHFYVALVNNIFCDLHNLALQFLAHPYWGLNLSQIILNMNHSETSTIWNLPSRIIVL